MALKRRNFPVQGMGCAACVARVEGALKACKGVRSVSVSLASNLARVDYDTDVCTPSDLQKTVRDAGYEMLVDGSDDEAESEAERAREDAFRALRRDTVIALALAALEMLISMGFKDFPGSSFSSLRRRSSASASVVSSNPVSRACSTAVRTWTRWCPCP